MVSRARLKLYTAARYRAGQLDATSCARVGNIIARLKEAFGEEICGNGERNTQKRQVALTVVPRSRIQVHARRLSFSLGDDISQLLCGRLHSLLYAGRAVDLFECAALAIGAA